jgi:hypothetical protein
MARNGESVINGVNGNHRVESVENMAAKMIIEGVAAKWLKSKENAAYAASGCRRNNL